MKSFREAGHRRRDWQGVLAGLLALLLSTHVLAQAGSSPPLVIEPSLAYNELRAGSAAHFRSGGGSPLVPWQVLAIPDDHRYLLWIELGNGRMHLLEQLPGGGFTTRKVFPVSIGKNGYGKEVEGDKRTPMGVYHFTRFIADADLVDFYGEGAYPINYPNAFDRRLNRTGYGIWLHGLPKDVDQRPLLDSDGCVVLDNDSLVEMGRYIDPGRTLVVLSEDRIRWRSLQDARRHGQGLLDDFESWKRDWERRDNDAYLSWYADSFHDGSRNHAQWSEYKRRVNNGKDFIEVEVSDLSVIEMPDAPGLVTVRFHQEYNSSNYRWQGWKEQLWRQTRDGWRIIYEGNG